MDAAILLADRGDIPGRVTAAKMGIGYLAFKRRRDKLRLTKRKNYVPLVLHIDPEFNDKLLLLCEASGMSRGRFARHMLRQAIMSHPQGDPKNVVS